MLEGLRVGRRTYLEGEKQIARGANFSTLAPALRESLSFLTHPSPVRSLGQEQHCVGGGTKHVVGDVAVPTRNLLGELPCQRRHRESHLVGVELLVRKRARDVRRLVFLVGVRVRVRVQRGSYLVVVPRGACLVGRVVVVPRFIGVVMFFHA